MARKESTTRKRTSAPPADRKRAAAGEAERRAQAGTKGDTGASATAGKGKPRRRGAGGQRARTRTGRPRRDLLGSPPAEATVMRDNRQRRFEAELEEHTATSPRLTGGDLDADWQRADSVGEEAVGGSVATPDQDVVDELGDALGVPRAPGEPFRTSEEILEARDARRHRR